MANVRALLVGIDRYQAVNPLSGCVADINAIEALLRKRVSPENLSLVALRDGEATRAKIIETFRSHLGAAEHGEIALFYFAGHGSQEPCPPEWAQLEPDGLNETIVCVDSRTKGVWDLADKEINALIEEAGAKGAQVVTIFDSCHSGGVTRAVVEEIPRGVRMAPTATDRRIISSYTDAAQARYDPAKTAAGNPPDPAHIALSACQPHQTAKELPMLGTHRGAFSYAFQESISLMGDDATYVDVAAAIRAKLHTQVADQAPDLYAGGGASSVTTFLGGAVQPRLLTANSDGGDWWLSAGAVDGITPPQSSGTIQIELRAHASSPAAGAVVADATVVDVAPNRSKLNVVERTGQTLDTAHQYLAVITKFAIPSLRVVVTGNGGSHVSAALAAASPLAIVTTAATAASGPTALTASTASTASTDGPSGIRPLTVDVNGNNAFIRGAAGAPIDTAYECSEKGLEVLAADIAHLARWHALLDRAAPGSRISAKVGAEVVALLPGQQTATVAQPSVALVNGVVPLAYSGAEPPRVQIRLTNAYDQRLYAALFDLTDSYACAKLFAEWISPGMTAWARQGKVLTFTIPDWRPTATEGTDRLKLIVSTVEFDADAWAMAKLLGGTRSITRGDVRDVEDEDPDDPVPDEAWGTSLLTIVTSRKFG